MTITYTSGAPTGETSPALTKCPVLHAILSLPFECPEIIQIDQLSVKHCSHVCLEDVCEVSGHAFDRKWSVEATERLMDTS